MLAAKSNEAYFVDGDEKTLAGTSKFRLSDLNWTDFEMTFDDLKRQNES